MGFASGFRTGLAAGGAERSMMPLVQGLGQMIGHYAEKAKKPAIRYSFGTGESSYDKYVKRKAAEEAAAEEKRRYEESMRMQREQMATQQQAAEAQEARAAETHESQMASQAQQREQAAELFERSKKKEAKIEAFRGLLQGAASKNKALTEQAWAALTPEMDEDTQKKWAKVEKEPWIDPATGQPGVDSKGNPIMKYSVGRDKDGNEDPKAMPAPAVTYNEDGSTTVEFPTGETQTFGSDDEFKNFLALFHPEAESTKPLGSKEEKAQATEKRAKEKHQLALIEAEQKRIDKARQNESVDPDVLDERQAKLDKRREKITGGVEGKGGRQTKTLMAGGKEVTVEADPDKRPTVRGAKSVDWNDERGIWVATKKDGTKTVVLAED